MFALSLKQMSNSTFHMFIHAIVEVSSATYAPFTLEQICSVSEFNQVFWNSSWSNFHQIQDVYMANMPKKTKLYSRFLLLKIYPDSPVHTSANTEHIQICPVML